MFIESTLFTLSVVACVKYNACSFLVVFPFLQTFQIDLILRNQIWLVWKKKKFVLRKTNICLFCSGICADEYLICRGRKSLSNTKVFFVLFHLKLLALFTEYAQNNSSWNTFVVLQNFENEFYFSTIYFFSCIFVYHKVYEICYICIKACLPQTDLSWKLFSKLACWKVNQYLL